jgi:hypothetical protein
MKAINQEGQEIIDESMRVRINNKLLIISSNVQYIWSSKVVQLTMDYQEQTREVVVVFLASVRAVNHQGSKLPNGQQTA